LADMNVKVMGYLRTTCEVAPHMAERGGGRIIYMSCLAALSTGSAIGSIRSVGVAALTKNLADELAPSGISVVWCAPRSHAHRKDRRVRRQAKAHGNTCQQLPIVISECHREKSAQITSNHECASLLRRPGVHIATAVEVIIDFGGGADHAAVKEDDEGRGLEVVFSERP
jgi:NAD(P)-dependent dehydrogenase (short-subunit alcohol dehydrogenase family)